MDQQSNPPHVLLFPLPFQGPVNCFLKLGELLSLSGLHVTFFTTTHVLNRLLRCTNTGSRFAVYPGFRFLTIPDGLPEDHPRTADGFMEVFDSLVAVSNPFLKERLSVSKSSSSPITCLILDGLFSSARDIAKQFGVPCIFFDTISPCCLWIYLCLPNLIEDGEIPFDENDLDKPLKGVPGMEAFLRRRDLPDFCRSPELNDPNLLQVEREIQQIPEADGLILNTFQELEGPTFLSSIRNRCKNLYTIGPLHSHLKARVEAKKMPQSTTLLSNSLWDEDLTCLKWLDEQPPKSVVFVSFGSLMTLNDKELMEFWHGLVNSKHKFLWVLRSNIIKGGNLGHSQAIPSEVAEATKERGCIVSWAPQEKVLAHPAIGGFLSHGGWNSTLESIAAGVPMICWPGYVDQMVNSRFVSEIWKIGLDMKDTCDRIVVEEMVKALMETRSDEFSRSASRLAALARTSVSEGGTSHTDFNRLVSDTIMLSNLTVDEETNGV